MKLISYWLILFVIELNNAKRKSSSSNVLRIPLTPTKMKKPISAHSRSVIVLDETSGLGLGKISIGQPAQDFDVLFDTGSEVLWVYSTSYDTCDPNSNIVSTKQKYNRQSSSTYQPKKDPKPKLYHYAYEWIFGFWVTDEITIAGVKIKKDFLEVTRASDDEVTSQENGILGLRYKPGEGNIVTKYCDSINGENKFSVYLPSVPNVTKGEILFCGVDKHKFKEETMKYITESRPGLWRIPIDSAEAGVSEETYPMASATVATVDTGTNQIVMPQENITVYLDHVYLVGNPALKKVHCAAVPYLPTLTITIGGVKYTFIGQEITWRIKNSCGLLLSPGPSDHWILGEPFLRKYYTVFDMRDSRIGIAESKG